MPVSRSASDKLLGYFYQFDRSILEILNLQNIDDSVTLEGYEDIDIDNLSGGENIQVKYLTSQNILLQDMTLAENEHIEKPILLSFLTYCQTNKPQKIIGYYNGTQNQIINIDLTKLNEIISRRTSTLNTHQKAILRSIDQSKKEQFVGAFTFEVVDTTYDQQVELIKTQISMKFSLTAREDVELYYDYSLSKVIQLVANQDTAGRTINKGQFIQSIDRKEILFNQRFLEKKGIDRYLNLIKQQYFTHSTIPTYERFFILHINDGITLEEVKNIILKIKNKFFRRRQDIPKPYFFLHGISNTMLKELKQLLWQEGCICEDGYYYHDGEFCCSHLCRKILGNQSPQIKILNSMENLISAMNLITTTLKIYEFYITRPLNIETTKEYHKINIKDLNSLSILFN